METSSAPGRPQPMLPIFAPVPDLDPAAYERMARQVRTLLGVDLTQYKPAQVWRRVHGFATTHGLATPDALIEKARGDAALRQAFMDMLTINVSEFFRNPEAWETFANRFLKPMLVGQPSVRIWSAGCSLGYEPFTIAMLVREIAPRATATILATDLDDTTLARARQATYTEAQMAGVSPARRSRFFRQVAGGWEVVPELRSMVTWRRHDLLKDPYERGLDIIACRNVVIYFTEEAKSVLYERFLGALRPGGLLFLGATESITNIHGSGFTPVAVTFYQRP